MAIYDLPRASVSGHPLGGRLAALYNAVLSWKDARATRRALSALSEHELDDIGLTRGDIDRISRF